MQECNSKQEGTSALPEVPRILRMAMDACPHGLTLCSGGAVLYSNAAWKRLETGASSELLGHVPDTRYATYDLVLNESPIQIKVLQDITERKQLENQLHEAQRLEALGRWVGAIVHDFRNVLTAVMLYSDLLEQRVEAGTPAAKYNDEVREAARRGTDLIGQLLSFARQRAPEVTVLSLNSLLNGIRDVLRRMSGEDVELKFDLCDSPCRARVDATQIQQVVFNLVVNARQAMPEGGHIVISTRESGVDPNGDRAASESGTGWVELVVSDEGVGMDEATLSRAFDPFFTTKPKGKGTGLGLTTVQSIVTQYGGSVSIESKPAHGTTVTIVLPRADATRSDDELELGTNDLPVGAETVLVVEDEASVRASISELLMQFGYRVLQASGGLEAIRSAETFEEPIDLLLADMVLPGLSGREIARRIKLSRPGLRVLFISGYESAQDEPESDIFSKPFTREALARKVREVLDSNRVRLGESGPTSV